MHFYSITVESSHHLQPPISTGLLVSSISCTGFIPDNSLGAWYFVIAFPNNSGLSWISILASASFFARSLRIRTNITTSATINNSPLTDTPTPIPTLALLLSPLEPGFNVSELGADVDGAVAKVGRVGDNTVNPREKGAVSSACIAYTAGISKVICVRPSEPLVVVGIAVSSVDPLQE